ncbi:hypothetical protein CDAR_108751 [Caerostris darwini]|uniref:Uncharacterized protein n=1 Tax=Caerostris darwini TaxID=1538125 RepID=A0AAV4V5H2_9ARAC|nr:hypothetical protein CDAR_108751 [Caerostris darwini]
MEQTKRSSGIPHEFAAGEGGAGGRDGRAFTANEYRFRRVGFHGHRPVADDYLHTFEIEPFQSGGCRVFPYLCDKRIESVIEEGNEFLHNSCKKISDVGHRERYGCSSEGLNIPSAHEHSIRRIQNNPLQTMSVAGTNEHFCFTSMLFLYLLLSKVACPISNISDSQKGRAKNHRG